MARLLWKQKSENDGNLVILTDVPYPTLALRLPNGKVITGRNSGPSNGYGSTIRFPAPGSAYNNVEIVAPGGQVIQRIGNGSERHETQDRNPNAGNVKPGEYGDAANPIFGDPSFLTYNPAEFQNAAVEEIEPVDPVDILKVAGDAAVFNRDQILSSFKDSRDVTRNIIDETLEADKGTLSNINDFNAVEQKKAFDTLGPDAAKALNTGISNLASFAEGRLPDALENEILNQSSRAIQSQQTNITGGGIASSFGNRVANQLTIQQRLGLQTSAINSAPSFLAQALELRRGSPQKLIFDPNRELNVRTAISDRLSQSSTISPAQTVQFEFNNTANELDVRKFNAGETNRTNQFNASGQFQESQFNAKALTDYQENLLNLDLFNKREQQNYEQELINAAKQDELDAQTQKQAQNNADASIESNESAAGNQVAQDVIGSIPAIVDTIDKLTGGEDDSENTGSGSTNTGTSTPSASSTSPSVPPVPRPAPSQPPIGSDGGNVTSPSPSPQPSPSPVPSPTPEPAIEDEIIDYEPEVTTTDSGNIRSLSVSPSTFQRSVTSPTFVNTRQTNAHKTARNTVPRMVDSSTLSKSQIQYADNSIGLDIQKPATDFKRIIGPVPSAIYPDIGAKKGEKVAEEFKAVTKAMNVKGLIPKPSIHSPIFKTEGMEISNLYLPISEDKKLSPTLSDILKNLSDLPVVNAVPVDLEGKFISNSKYYAETAADEILQKAKGG